MLTHVGIKKDGRIAGTIIHKVEDHHELLDSINVFLSENGQDEFFDEIMRGQYEGGIHEFDCDGAITMLDAGNRHSMGSKHCLNDETFSKDAEFIYLVENSEVQFTKQEILEIEDS